MQEMPGNIPPQGRAARSAFVPLLILALTVTAWAAFQMTQLLREREALEVARSNQERPMENSRKLRDQLDDIARATQVLANKGNAGAKLIVDELKRRGITISTDPPAAADKK